MRWSRAESFKKCKASWWPARPVPSELEVLFKFQSEYLIKWLKYISVRLVLVIQSYICLEGEILVYESVGEQMHA